MIIRAMLLAAVIGFIYGMVKGLGFHYALLLAGVFAVIAIPVRKWLASVFWK